jgi:hypothetical protein
VAAIGFGGGHRRWRIEVALAGAVVAIRRKKKSISSFLPRRSGMADPAGHWARQGGLRPGKFLSLFSSFNSFSFSYVFYF